MGKFHFTKDDLRENARDDYKALYIRRSDIRKNEKNGYSIDDDSIANLATSIEMGGLQNPLIVCRKPEGGTQYLLLSGERRLTAIDYLMKKGAWLDQDGMETDEIPCRVTDFDTINLPLSEENKMDFSIVLTNAFNRVLTDGDRIFQTRAMKQVLDELRENGVTKYDFGLGETQIVGKNAGTARIDRQIIAQLNQQSGSQQSLFEFVDAHGVRSLLDLLESDEITIAVANEIAHLPSEEQEAFLADMIGEEKITRQMVKEWSAKAKTPDAEDRPEPEREDDWEEVTQNTEEESAKEIIKEEKKTCPYTRQDVEVEFIKASRRLEKAKNGDPKKVATAQIIKDALGMLLDSI